MTAETIRLLTEEKDALSKRLKVAEKRLARIKGIWSKVSKDIKIKGTVEEGLLVMAKQIRRHMYPWA